MAQGWPRTALAITTENTAQTAMAIKRARRLNRGMSIGSIVPYRGNGATQGLRTLAPTNDARQAAFFRVFLPLLALNEYRPLGAA